MELNGALSNLQRATGIVEAGVMRERILTSGPGRSKPSPTLGPRPGRISNAVRDALESAEAPIRAIQIHAEAERALGQPVRFGSVKQVLSLQASRSTGWALRVERGRYVPRRPGR